MASYTSPVTRDRITKQLKAMSFKAAVLDDVTVLLPIGPHLFRIQLANNAAFLMISAPWHRLASISCRDELEAFCAKTNVGMFAPKAYTRAEDDGTVLVIAESNHIITHGLTDTQLNKLLSDCLQEFHIFFNHLTQDFPDIRLHPESAS
ncbi:MAG: YbjN domain-containing protein [Actinomycetaceae bacterium]|nr:YbjN domain-containing protein [Actinomycetaceae bacterium]